MTTIHRAIRQHGRASGIMGGVFVGAGLRLEAGEDGTLPVSLRWVHATDGVETFAVSDGVVYVAAVGDVFALSLLTGGLIWESWQAAEELDVSYESSGGVAVGVDGPEGVRVFAPWTYDLRVDRSTGDIRSLTAARGGELPTDFDLLENPSPTTFDVEVGLTETVARWPDGRTAWRLIQESPQFDELEATEADGILVLPATTGHILALNSAGEQRPDASRRGHLRAV